MTLSTAILYTRVSTSQQEREGTSLESQLQACEKYAREHGYKIARRITDTHSGADLWDRPGINEARQAIQRREATVLIAYAIDRLSRNPAHLLILLEEASRFDARIEFVTERMEDSAEWKLIQYVKSYAAELEREKIRERSMRGMRQRVIQGRLPHASITLYGYQLNAEEERREVFEPEAQIVRRIFTSTSDGWSRRALANALNAEGVPSPAIGKRTYKDQRITIWNISSIRRILEEPAYCGDARGWRWTHKKKKVIERPLSEQFRVSTELCPAIVSQNVWEAANARSKANRGALTHNTRNFSLLRGLITCARCHRTLTPSEDQYRCNSRKLAMRYCGARGVARKGVEDWVWQEIEKTLFNPEKIITGIFQTGDSRQSDNEDVDRQITEAQKRLANLERGQERVLRTIASTDDAHIVALAQKQLSQMADDRRRTITAIDKLKQSSHELTETSQHLRRLNSYLAKLKTPTSQGELRQTLEMLGAEVIAEKGSWRLWLSLLDTEATKEDSGGEIRSQHTGIMITSPRVMIASRVA